MSYLNKYLGRSDVVVMVDPERLDAAKEALHDLDVEILPWGDHDYELDGRRIVGWGEPYDTLHVKRTMRTTPGILPVVGLTGKAGSGKDTAAQALVDRGFCKIALADAVKRAATEIYGYDPESLWGPSERRNCAAFAVGEPRARRGLQLLGTEFGRALREDTWILRLFREMDKVIEDKSGGYYTPNLGLCHGLSNNKGYTGFVIPDVRFDNEAAAIYKVGGIVLRIDRPGVGPSVPDHASEHGVSPGLGDAAVVNDEGIPALHAKVRHAVDHYLNNTKESK